MANHASAKKRARQNEKRASRNRHVKTTVRTYVKRLRAALHEKNLKGAEDLWKSVSSGIDSAVAKGVYHRKTGSRYISRLALQLRSLRTSNS